MSFLTRGVSAERVEVLGLRLGPGDPADGAMQPDARRLSVLAQTAVLQRLQARRVSERGFYALRIQDALRRLAAMRVAEELQVETRCEGPLARGRAEACRYRTCKDVVQDALEVSLREE